MTFDADGFGGVFLAAATKFMTDNKRKPKKSEIYQILIDTYMEH